MVKFEIVSICKGGGYHYARTIPLHPKANANGLYPLHRIIVENKLGRLLKPGEIVHHIDGNKNNDISSNLEVLNNAVHTQQHKTKGFMVVNCKNCKVEVQVKPYDYRKRMKTNRRGIFCSLRCAGKKS